MKSYFADGSKGASFDSRPDVDTSAASAPGVRGTGGAWTFDITPIVQKWADGTLANNGIGLVPSSPTPADTWEVVWIGTGAQGPRTEGTVQVPAVDRHAPVHVLVPESALEEAQHAIEAMSDPDDLLGDA